MRWFGESWGALVNQISPRIDVPVDELCVRCTREFRPEHSGFAIPAITTYPFAGVAEGYSYFHRACFYADLGSHLIPNLGLPAVKQFISPLLSTRHSRQVTESRAGTRSFPKRE